MFDNNKTVVSNIVGLTDTLVKPEIAKASGKDANYNYQIEPTTKSFKAEELTDISHKLKACKKIFEFVKIDTRKSINKAKNLRNNALRKVYQAEEILEGAKEDWKTKVITANKKIKEFKSNSENTYLRNQAKQAIHHANQAKENIINKKSELTKRKLQLQKCEENLKFVKLVQRSRIQFAEIAYMRVEMEQQKTIQSTDNHTLGWGIAGKTHYRR